MCFGSLHCILANQAELLLYEPFINLLSANILFCLLCYPTPCPPEVGEQGLYHSLICLTNSLRKSHANRVGDGISSLKPLMSLMDTHPRQRTKVHRMAGGRVLSCRESP